MNRQYLIIGAGHQGMAMAAHLALNGECIRLWNRTLLNIKEIGIKKEIECNGCVQGIAKLDMVSDKIEDVITDTILVTVPSTGHKDIARMLAKRILPNTVIYLNPGRTFGAIEFYEELIKCGCLNIPCIVETQSIIYTCRKISSTQTYIYILKKDVKMARIGGTDELIYERLPDSIRDRFVICNSVLETSLSNIGMILHCAPVLFNIGWIESESHDFKYYYDGISESVAKILEKMDKERVEVAKRAGIKVDTLVEWFFNTYGVHGKSILECIRKTECYGRIDAPNSLEHRYLDEDVPNGLVPVEYLGKDFGIDVSMITLIIDLACQVRKQDYRNLGRKYSIEKIKEGLF